MLVDDHKTVLWGLAQLIQSAAPRMVVVGQASSRAQLLAGLASANPDLILLDLDLDGECGMDCIEDLMPLSQAMVLVLTGSTDTDVHQQAVMRGARGVVRKLEPAQVILTAIEKVRAGEIWLDRVSLGRVMTALSNGRGTDPQARKFANLTAKERQIVAAVIA
jgi:DNA-binding NarL/FixJ family response regulator